MKKIKGADISTLYEVEQAGGRFYCNGVQMDALEILKSYGFNAVRLRIWNNPYSETGESYGAGTNDLAMTIRLAKRAVAMKMDFLLDFHYSDFWTDPGKQLLPKAWKGLSVEAIEHEVYQFTKGTLTALRDAKVMPTMIQIGNELSNGLLWPTGKVPNYSQITRYVNAGIRGVRELDKEIPIMIHLDNGGNNELYRTWFDEYCKEGEDFQVIGLSYYPFWHGTLESLYKNMSDIAIRYNKDLIVAEVSMGYTMEDYSRYEGRGEATCKMATKPELVEKIEHPMTKEGQCQFLKDFFHVLDCIPNNKAKGFYYWEPAWIPVKDVGWATKASLKYMGLPEDTTTGNEWANQALFDYDGNALPSMDTISDY